MATVAESLDEVNPAVRKETSTYKIVCTKCPFRVEVLIEDEDLVHWIKRRHGDRFIGHRVIVYRHVKNMRVDNYVNRGALAELIR